MSQVLTMIFTAFVFYAIISLILGTFILIRLKLDKKKRNAILEYYNLIFLLRDELWNIGAYLDETPNYNKLLICLDESTSKVNENMDYLEFYSFKKSFSKKIKKYDECIKESAFYNSKIKHILENLDIDTENFN